MNNFRKVVEKCYELTDIYRDHQSKSDNYSWKVKTMTKKILMSLIMSNPAEYRGTEIGDYIVLATTTQIVMSNTMMEIRTNYPILMNAGPNVLILGLGLGMIPYVLQQDPNIKSITIIEREQEIIDKVTSIGFLGKKVKIVKGDAYQNDFGDAKFQSIWIDIWNDISGDNYESMKVLTKLYKKNVDYKNKGWIDCWRKDDCRRMWQESAQDRMLDSFLNFRTKQLKNSSDGLTDMQGIKL